MKGQDFFKALNDVDIDMIEEAGSFETTNFGHGIRLTGPWAKRGLAAAAILVLIGSVFASPKPDTEKNDQASQAILYTENTKPTEPESRYRENIPDPSDSSTGNEFSYIEANDTYLVTAPILHVPDQQSDIVSNPNLMEADCSGGICYDLCPVSIGRAEFSDQLKAALNEGRKKVDAGEITADQIYYLVEVNIIMPDSEIVTPPSGIPLTTFKDADEEIREAEFKRLSEDCGYGLTWVAPGGYRISDDYLFVLVKGRMYGAFTEEQLLNFKANSEYAYVLNLISQNFFTFTKYPYQENYTEEDLKRSLEQAVK